LPGRLFERTGKDRNRPETPVDRPVFTDASNRFRESGTTVTMAIV
jgi:hypothetical protein